jgi:acyl-[acyl-carrier-protein]-phospholipid O-acyltransferase / long-chain-fatty-acid--[acyl-carrier-protein] ligase
VDAVRHLLRIEKTDVVLGVLPFFHSFGFTGTLWTVLSLDPKGVYHFNPLDARTVGRLCQKHKVTVLLTAPSFLRLYLRRCQKEQFQSLDAVIVSAEKMPVELAHAFQDKFGVLPVEAYGCTELSPTAATNVPDDRLLGTTQKGAKEGTVGRPIPETLARVVDPDSGQDLGTDKDGMLLISGPNVMLGYLNRPEKTAEVMRDGWYVTGDIARIDREGFITITDRASRFSKIGGEMVPHLKVEESLRKVIGESPAEDDDLRLAVTAIPDPEKGERLVVIHKPLDQPIDTILGRLSAAGLPNLWIPSRSSFVEVPEIPVLGAGKVDLKAVKQLALTRLGPKTSPKTLH